jgi:hypothetical protein
VFPVTNVNWGVAPEELEARGDIIFYSYKEVLLRQLSARIEMWDGKCRSHDGLCLEHSDLVRFGNPLGSPGGLRHIVWLHVGEYDKDLSNRKICHK